MSTRSSNEPTGSSLMSKIESGEARCGIIGLGYVGLPLAVEMANAGLRVLGYDVSERAVNGINAGTSHIKDISSEVLAPLVRDGLISATTDPSRLGECDVIAICVPTPLSKTRDPDVSYVVASAE